LSDQALRRSLGDERVWFEAKAMNMRVGSDEIDASDVFDFGDGGDLLRAVLVEDEAVVAPLHLRQPL
jgi:hypothetical protein